MGIADNYGEFEVPEEKSVIEVVEDPVKSIISYYDLFKRVCKKITKNVEFADHNTYKQIYKESLKLMEEKEDLKINGETLENIKQKILNEKERNTCPSLFLSCIHNTMNIQTLIVNNFPRQLYLGYELKPNKTLIIGPQMSVWDAGDHCEGNILNYGEISHLASYAKGGVQINHCYCTSMAYASEGGIQISTGKTSNTVGPYATGGIQIQNEILMQYLDKETKIHNWSNLIRTNKRLQQLQKKLEEKINETKFLEQADLPFEEQIKKVNLFDFKKFEKEMTEICGQIPEIYKNDEHNR